MIIGERVKEARKNKNLSQQQLGDMLGVSKVSICGYENGVRIPTIENFVQLLDILDLSADYLLGRETFKHLRTQSAEEDEEYKVKLSKEDINIIKELKNNSVLHNKLRNDPKRTIELINRKLNK